MTKLKFLRSHRAWEDWLGMAIGSVIVLSPWLTKESADPQIVLNAAVAGFAIMMLAELDLVQCRRWAEAGQLVCGAWVATSSFIFGYSGSGALRYWHIVAGLTVVLLGSLELWQLNGQEKSNGQGELNR